MTQTNRMTLLNRTILSSSTTTGATALALFALILRSPALALGAALLGVVAARLIVSTRRWRRGAPDPAPFTSPEVVATWGTLPERPAWATSERRYGPDWDGDDYYGSWECEVPNTPGPMSIQQDFFRHNSQSAWEVSPAAWMPGSAHDDAHSAEECRALAAGLLDAADLIEKANAETRELQVSA